MSQLLSAFLRFIFLIFITEFYFSVNGKKPNRKYVNQFHVHAIVKKKSKHVFRQKSFKNYKSFI